MRNVFIFILICLKSILFAQPTTEEGNPVIVGGDVEINYGIRHEVLLKLINIYSKGGKGYEKELDKLLREYSKTPEKTNLKPELSQESIKKLRIRKKMDVLNALNWDLFASTYYISNSGSNNPIVFSDGHVEIWYGLPPKAFQSIVRSLNLQKLRNDEFQERLKWDPLESTCRHASLSIL